jgi:hypothetical protein
LVGVENVVVGSEDEEDVEAIGGEVVPTTGTGSEDRVEEVSIDPALGLEKPRGANPVGAVFVDSSVDSTGW